MNTVRWSPDGSRLASSSDDRTIRVWDVDAGAEALILHGHTAPVYAVCWSPDGSRLASVSQDGTARIWDASDGSEALTLQGTGNPLGRWTGARTGRGWRRATSTATSWSGARSPRSAATARPGC